MTTKFIEPTNDHIGQTIEVSNNQTSWTRRELVYVLPEKFAKKFICPIINERHKTYDWAYARIEAPKTYAELQAESGLKVGDWVKVTRIAKDFESGWGTVWNNDMNVFVGRVFQIGNICSTYGISSHGGWNFPFFVLEKTEAPETKEEKIDKLIRLFKEELVKIL